MRRLISEPGRIPSGVQWAQGERGDVARWRPDTIRGVRTGGSIATSATTLRVSSGTGASSGDVPTREWSLDAAMPEHVAVPHRRVRIEGGAISRLGQTRRSKAAGASRGTAGIRQTTPPRWVLSTTNIAVDMLPPDRHENAWRGSGCFGSFASDQAAWAWAGRMDAAFAAFGGSRSSRDRRQHDTLPLGWRSDPRGPCPRRRGGQAPSKQWTSRNRCVTSFDEAGWRGASASGVATGGSFTFNPTANWNGTTSFTYMAVLVAGVCPDGPVESRPRSRSPIASLTTRPSSRLGGSVHRRGDHRRRTPARSHDGPCVSVDSSSGRTRAARGLDGWNVLDDHPELFSAGPSISVSGSVNGRGSFVHSRRRMRTAAPLVTVRCPRRRRAPLVVASRPLSEPVDLRDHHHLGQRRPDGVPGTASIVSGRPMTLTVRRTRRARRIDERSSMVIPSGATAMTSPAPRRGYPRRQRRVQAITPHDGVRWRRCVLVPGDGWDGLQRHARRDPERHRDPHLAADNRAAHRRATLRRSVSRCQPGAASFRLAGGIGVARPQCVTRYVGRGDGRRVARTRLEP